MKLLSRLWILLFILNLWAFSINLLSVLDGTSSYVLLNKIAMGISFLAMIYCVVMYRYWKRREQDREVIKDYLKNVLDGDSAELEDELGRVFNFNICKELLTEVNPNISDEEVTEVLNNCNGNPWDARILYELKGIANENNKG